LDQKAWLARAPLGDGVLPFFFQRPGQNTPAPSITHSEISRRHLELTPIERDFVHVRNHADRPLLVNGRPVDGESMIAPGDSLMIDGVALFLVELRPKQMMSLQAFDSAPFEFGHPDPFSMVGESVAAWQLRDHLGMAAANDEHTLLWGEPGSGKEASARTVHGLSKRSKGPFIARNATTVPHGLADAELFGCSADYTHKGAAERIGEVGAADKGCLLLDEIGDLHSEIQAKLLRVLELGELTRLGDGRVRSVDVQFIGATNRDPAILRLDFRDRFTFRIVVPSLRERRSDIPLLVGDLFARMASTMSEWVERFCPDGNPRRPNIDPDFLRLLLEHTYTGNARELERIVRASANYSFGRFLTLTGEVSREMKSKLEQHGEAASSGELDSAPPPAAGDPSAPKLRPHELHSLEAVKAALQEARGNVTFAAHGLRLKRGQMIRLMQRYGIKRDSGED
jgi:transcriptional regulator with GAF, ATPase, and Fis domain